MTRSPEPPDPPAPPPAAPPAVSRFEYNLLRVLRFLLGHAPPDQAKPLLDAKFAAPPCLSPACVRLARETIAKGLVLRLVKAGGWRKEKFLRAAGPTDGRAWERTPLPDRKLAFTPHLLDVLIWLTAEKVGDTKEPWPRAPQELTAADELFFAVAFENLRDIPDLAPKVAANPAFRKNPLCWLTFPGDVSAPAPDIVPPAFDRYTTGLGAVILECLQPALAKLWTRSERAKGRIEDWKKMRQQGLAEFAALTNFLAAADKANRPDLARFVLRAAGAIFASGELSPEFWTGGLKDSRPQRLADRLETTRAALAVPRQLETLRGWDRKARTVGFFDEDYAASQLWKADWEAGRGDEVTARAHRVLEQLEPLRTA